MSLKTALKNILYPLCSALPKIQTALPYTLYGDPDFETFIGYYDIQPFNTLQDKMLAGRVRKNGGDMEVGYYVLDTGVFTSIGRTPLWSWQQGCRLQWVNWQGRETILYHGLDGAAKPVTILYDPKSGSIHTWDFLAFALSACGRYAAGLDFGLLAQHRPGYGYGSLAAGAAEITVYNLDDGAALTRIALNEVLAVSPRAEWRYEDCIHYFNHLHFNSDSSRLMAFHIWQVRDKRKVRALTLDLDGGNIKDVTASDHVSHYAWMDNQTLLFYGTDTKAGQGYHLYRQSGGLIRSLENLPRKDGHPSRHPLFKDKIIGDHVVNRFSRRDLWVYDMASKRKNDLASFFSPKGFAGANRCDLHPRLSPRGDLIAVDSAHAGFRQVVVLKTLLP